MSAPYETALIIGFARTGQAVARVLQSLGSDVVAVDDAPDAKAQLVADELGIELVASPDTERLSKLASQSQSVVVSPGIPPSHAVFSSASVEKIISEIELAYALTTVPIVAVTGTNGKTSVTGLVTEMLGHSGIKARAVGNIGSPLIETVGADLDIAVAEVSSFQLAYTKTFQPIVGTWLNFSNDHLDWHPNSEDYAAAKARIWAAQHPSDVAIANRDDEVVWSNAQRVRARCVSFGIDDGDYRMFGEFLIGPNDVELARTDDLPRNFPHDRTNALAAFATALSSGATLSGCLEALHNTPIPHHRVELVADFDGVRYFDDSKATTPSAVIAALKGLSSVVLIAGGRNKGLSLGDIRSHVDRSPALQLRAVVAIGESQDEVASAFTAGYRVERAESMGDAVRIASEISEPGDAVLLSPGCASFDWYRSYEERGADFGRCVLALRSSSQGVSS